MANIKQQIKRVRTNERRRLRNKAVSSRLHTEVRKFDAATRSGDLDAAASQLAVASRLLDKAASKGVIHRNQAANRKSGMATRLNGLRSA